MKNKTTYNRTMHDKKHPYTLVSAQLINNSDLTGEERFLMIYLFGRSDDFILNSSYFANNAQELFGWGRDKFYKIWKSLKEKGYISKVTLRDKGMIAGQHYTVHEILKNQNTENPESGESGIRCTSALLSIDKPIIDKPITDQPRSTKTNQKVRERPLQPGSKSVIKQLETNDQVQQIFNLICEVNPPEHSDNWKMNDQDRDLIEKAINELGFVDTQAKVINTVGKTEKPYYSTSYIFADYKDKSEKENYKEFLQQNPDFVPDFINAAFSNGKVEDAKTECEDEQQFYDFIKEAVTQFHQDAKNWSPSDEDLDYCRQLLYCDPNIELAQKLRDGLKSAFEKDEWRFGQIIYQAITAIENREVSCPQ